MCLCAGFCHSTHQGFPYQHQGTQPRVEKLRLGYSETCDLLNTAVSFYEGVFSYSLEEEKKKELNWEIN